MIFSLRFAHNPDLLNSLNPNSLGTLKPQPLSKKVQNLVIQQGTLIATESAFIPKLTQKS